MKREQSKLKKEKPEFKIVGGASVEKKKEIEESLFGLFGEKHLEDLPKEILEEVKKFEHIKTLEELQAIEFANQITNQLITECGIIPYDFPEKNVHILPLELYRKITNSGSAGRAAHARQAIFLNASKVRGKGDLRFANISFHEMLHIKSFTSFEVERDEKGENVTLLQRGLEILSTQKNNDKEGDYINLGGGGLNEAIISHYEKYFISEALKSDLFKEEKEWLDSNEAKGLKKKIFQENNIPEEEIYVVNRNGSFDAHGYPKHEVVLEKITDKIYKDNLEKFNSREEVIREFLKTMIAGNILNIAKLVENSFGPKSFMVLSMMKENRRSAAEILEYFK